MRLIDAPAVVAERGEAADRCAVVTLGRESAERDDTRLPCTKTGSWRFRGIASGLHQVRRRGPWRGRDRNRGETRVSGPGARRMLLGGSSRPVSRAATRPSVAKHFPGAGSRRRVLGRRSDHASARRWEPKAIVHRGVTGWSALGHPARPAGEPLPPCLDSDCPSTARASPPYGARAYLGARVALAGERGRHILRRTQYSVPMRSADPGRKVGGDQGGVPCHRPPTGPRSVACFRWSWATAVAAGCAGCSARSPRTRGCSARYRPTSLTPPTRAISRAGRRPPTLSSCVTPST